MPDAKHPLNYIDSTAELRGVLKSVSGVEIHGVFEGSVQTDNMIVVSNDGLVKGEIKTKDALIDGQVEGYIEARGVLIASAGSALSCNVAAARLVTETGATIHGEMIVTPNWQEELSQRAGLTNARESAEDASTRHASASSEPSNLPPQTVVISADFPTARRVKLFGSFNQWDKTKAYKLRRTQSGQWSTQIRLSPGTYEYLFLVNGKAETDPSNPRKSPNSYGGVNSVLIVESSEESETATQQTE